MTDVTEQYQELYGPIPLTIFGMSPRTYKKVVLAMRRALSEGRPLTNEEWGALESETLEQVGGAEGVIL